MMRGSDLAAVPPTPSSNSEHLPRSQTPFHISRQTPAFLIHTSRCPVLSCLLSFFGPLLRPSSAKRRIHSSSSHRLTSVSPCRLLRRPTATRRRPSLSRKERAR